MTTTTTTATWRRVTRADPCVVCGRPDWCGSTDTGLLRCMRNAEAPAGYKLIRTDADGGYLFAPTDDAPRPPRPPRPRPKPARPAPDFEKMHAAGVAELHPGELHDFADIELGLSGPGAEALQPTVVDGRYAFPERDADGRIIGLVRRDIDGRKICCRGSRRGLTYIHPLPDTDPVLVVEGASDCAAALEAGFNAVGRPSASGGGELLAELLRGRHVIVCGENDEKSNGSWPGREGAERIADKLRPVCESVRLVFPPDETKDIRSWLSGGEL